MGYVDTKEFAKAMREQRVRDSNGNIICSEELWEVIAQIIESLPGADVVEVVRCENCRNRIEKDWAKCKGRKPTDYCSDGVSRWRKELE